MLCWQVIVFFFAILWKTQEEQEKGISKKLTAKKNNNGIILMKYTTGWRNLANKEKQSALGEETMCIKCEENELTNQKTDEVITDIQTCLRRKQIDERILNTGLLKFS